MNFLFSKASLLLFASLFCFSLSSAKSEVMFEGYYKILLNDEHIGYNIQKYEFDAKKKQFKSIYFIYAGLPQGEIIESLSAVSNDKFQPISYQYTLKKPGITQTIDAKFDKNKMDWRSNVNGKSQSQNLAIQNGVFLSTFLNYLILQKGYSIGKKFSYKAISEEDGLTVPGDVLVKESTTQNGIESFKVLNQFKDLQFVSYVTSKGEVLSTDSPTQKIKTILVSEANEATKGKNFPTKTFKLLFGNIPTGKTNQLSQNTSKPDSKSIQSEPPKTLPEKKEISN